MKEVNINRSIVVDLDWLEKAIKESGTTTGFQIAAWRAYKNVLENSTPLSRVCEVVYNEGIANGETTYNDFDNKKADKLKETFLNSKIKL